MWKLVLGLAAMLALIAGIAFLGGRWDTEHRAGIAAEGETAGRGGVPCEACPYTGNNESHRAAWMRGWTRGFRSRGR